MKKISTTVVVFIAAALMVTGCDDKKKKNDNTNLLMLMILAENAVPPTQTTGSDKDTADTTSATFATATALTQVRGEANPNGTTMMNSIAVDASDPYVADGLKKSIVDVVNENAGNKMKTVYASCSGTEDLGQHLTAAITGTGYSVTPDVTVTGSFTCNSSTTTAQSFSATLKITGTVTATFTNLTVQVFDINTYLDDRSIAFKNVVVNGTITVSNIIVDTAVSFNLATAPIPSVNLAVSNASTVTVGSTNYQVDGTTVPFDLTVNEGFKFNLAATPLPIWSGKVFAIVSGTVNGNEISMSYGFNGASLLKFSTYLEGAIGYGL